ncbi:MAG: glycosyltransferase [Oscillospiraceae bacterium]|nr:glycosyltransferase [Oscillospiraceae bacterium]
MENKENVIILPKTSDQNLLARYYSMADAFVICSKRENFPTTCIEAQCCGTPVVGFDTGGTKETSIDVNKDDDFVPYGAVDELADRINNKLNSEAVDVSEKAINLYSKENMGRRYIEEYDKGGHKERVLLIDVNCKGSSTGKIVYDLYSRLKSDGRKAAVCYGRGKALDEEGLYKFGLDWETLVHAALARISGYNGCFSPLSTRRLIRYIDEFDPDIIHIHELHAYFVNIKPLLNHIKRKNIPVIWTFHCEYMYTGKCGHAFECKNYQKECGNCPAVREYPKSLFLDKTRQMLRAKKQLLADLDFTIVTPSQWLADRVKTSFLKDKKLKVIHNGIDTSIFHPVDTADLRKELGIPPENKVVLALAPDIMSEQKGGKWVLQLAEIMKDTNTTFVLVGKE